MNTNMNINNHILETFNNIPQNMLKNNNSFNRINKNIDVPQDINSHTNSKVPFYSLKTNGYHNNGYHNNDDPAIELLPKKNNNQLVSKPFSNNHINVTNYNNEKYRMNSMAEELFEKDEEIQKYKNEVYQLQIELNDVKKAKSQMISADMENKMLKDKLNEHYEISRELTSVKHQLKREQLENKGSNETIETLKNIIQKQHVQLSSRQVQQTKEIEISESEEEIYSSDSSSEEESDYSSSESEDETPVKKPPLKKQPVKKLPVKKQPVKKQPVKKQDNIKETIKEIGIKPTITPRFSISQKPPVYYNQNLKNALLNQNIDPKKIDQTMKIMKITPKTKITKELINDFLIRMK